jgi:hypothetical protein
MAKVKPYIITVKYVSFYADPRPTVEQIANELNMDALEICIEEALVTSAPKRTTVAPVSIEPEPETEPEPEIEKPVPAAAVSRSETYGKDDAPFDTYDLDRTGPSMKILSLLYRAGKKGKSAQSIQEATGLGRGAMQNTISRLKRRGRIRQTQGPAGSADVFTFVQ